MTDTSVQANLGLVGLVIARNRHLVSGGYPYEDAYQDGCIGLVIAARSYQPPHNWSSFAYQRVLWSIQQGQSAALGKNYRAAVTAGTGYQHPHSLDWPTFDADSHPTTFVSLLVDPEPEDNNPRREATARLVATLNHGDQVCVTNLASTAATILGIKKESALRRRQRVYDRLRAKVATGALSWDALMEHAS